MKLEAVLEYTDFKRRYHKRGVTREFIKKFKDKYPDFNINCDVLEEWVNKYAKYGVEGLLDRRGGSRVGTTTLTEDVQNVFKVYYLSDKKPSIHQCYIATKEVFASKGIEIPENLDKLYKGKSSKFVDSKGNIQDYVQKQKFISDFHAFGIVESFDYYLVDKTDFSLKLLTISPFSVCIISVLSSMLVEMSNVTESKVTSILTFLK